MGSDMTSTVASGRPPRVVSDQITSRLLKASAHLFLRHGYEKTSMDAVAAKAGISKRTLYSRFPSKAELFEVVVNSVLERSIRSFKEAPTELAAFADALREFATNLLEALLVVDVIALERVVVGEAGQFPDLAARLHARFKDYIVDLLADLIIHFEPADRRARADVHRDAELFLAMVALPPLRRAVLFQSKPGLTDEDRQAIDRAVEIFVKGARS